MRNTAGYKHVGQELKGGIHIFDVFSPCEFTNLCWVSPRSFPEQVQMASGIWLGQPRYPWNW